MGTPLGQPFSARDAIVVQGDGATWTLVITDYDNACSRYPGVAGSTFMSFKYSGTTSPTAATYSALDASPWDLQTYSLDTACTRSDDASGRGTLWLTSVMPDAAGSFELTFSTATGEQHVTGDFTAPVCQIPLSAWTTCR